MFDKRLWQTAQKSRFWLLLTISLSGLGAAATIMQAYLISLTVNGVFLAQDTLMDVQPWLIGLLLVMGIRACLSWGREMAANRIAIEVQLALRERLLKQVLAWGPVAVYGEQTGELTAVLTEGVDRLEKYFSEYLPPIIYRSADAAAHFAGCLSSGLDFRLDPAVDRAAAALFMTLIGRYAEKIDPAAVGFIEPHERPFPRCAARINHAQTVGAKQAASQKY
ncbi:MAG: ABC transporter transmembrane domain-containing protein [Chloroflexi bacterium]|nr:ABC transporter transmembrane domain-containing protein [Chloroflexota bacterium]